jgi:hypothetical protein
LAHCGLRSVLYGTDPVERETDDVQAFPQPLQPAPFQSQGSSLQCQQGSSLQGPDSCPGPTCLSPLHGPQNAALWAPYLGFKAFASTILVPWTRQFYDFFLTSFHVTLPGLPAHLPCSDRCVSQQCQQKNSYRGREWLGEQRLGVRGQKKAHPKPDARGHQAGLTLCFPQRSPEGLSDGPSWRRPCWSVQTCHYCLYSCGRPAPL